MRLRAYCVLLALFAPPVMAAQEQGASSSIDTGFHSTSFRHDVLLREAEEDTSAANRPTFPLPPGGHELEMQPTSSTPYDRYFGSVRSVIANLEPHSTSMVKACHLMKVGHSFEYASRDPYRPDPPKLTEMQRSGDCKSKALWLYDNLADAGALFVIGKAEKSLSTSHAWVYWRCSGRWWILDCTDRADPIAADTVPPDRYVPYYSFGKLGTYRHPAGKLAATSTNGTAITAPVTSPNSPRKAR